MCDASSVYVSSCVVSFSIVARVRVRVRVTIYDLHDGPCSLSHTFGTFIPQSSWQLKRPVMSAERRGERGRLPGPSPHAEYPD